MSPGGLGPGGDVSALSSTRLSWARALEPGRRVRVLYEQRRNTKAGAAWADARVLGRTAGGGFEVLFDDGTNDFVPAFDCERRLASCGGAPDAVAGPLFALYDVGEKLEVHFETYTALDFEEGWYDATVTAHGHKGGVVVRYFDGFVDFIPRADLCRRARPAAATVSQAAGRGARIANANSWATSNANSNAKKQEAPKAKPKPEAKPKKAAPKVTSPKVAPPKVAPPKVAQPPKAAPPKLNGRSKAPKAAVLVGPRSSPAKDRAPERWVQCESCSKWRGMPRGSDVDADRGWECFMVGGSTDCETPQRPMPPGAAEAPAAKRPLPKLAPPKKPPKKPRQKGPPKKAVKRDRPTEWGSKHKAAAVAPPPPPQPTVLILSWAQCDACHKWRILGAHDAAVDGRRDWFCAMRDSHTTCATPDEASEDDTAQRDVDLLISVSTAIPPKPKRRPAGFGMGDARIGNAPFFAAPARSPGADRARDKPRDKPGSKRAKQSKHRASAPASPPAKRPRTDSFPAATAPFLAPPADTMGTPRFHDAARFPDAADQFADDGWAASLRSIGAPSGLDLGRAGLQRWGSTGSLFDNVNPRTPRSHAASLLHDDMEELEDPAHRRSDDDGQSGQSGEDDAFINAIIGVAAPQSSVAAARARAEPPRETAARSPPQPPPRPPPRQAPRPPPPRPPTPLDWAATEPPRRVDDRPPSRDRPPPHDRPPKRYAPVGDGYGPQYATFSSADGYGQRGDAYPPRPEEYKPPRADAHPAPRADTYARAPAPYQPREAAPVYQPREAAPVAYQPREAAPVAYQAREAAPAAYQAREAAPTAYQPREAAPAAYQARETAPAAYQARETAPAPQYAQLAPPAYADYQGYAAEPPPPASAAAPVLYNAPDPARHAAAVRAAVGRTPARQAPLEQAPAGQAPPRRGRPPVDHAPSRAAAAGGAAAPYDHYQQMLHYHELLRRQQPAAFTPMQAFPQPSYPQPAFSLPLQAGQAPWYPPSADARRRPSHLSFPADVAFISPEPSASPSWAGGGRAYYGAAGGSYGGAFYGGDAFAAPFPASFQAPFPAPFAQQRTIMTALAPSYITVDEDGRFVPQAALAAPAADNPASTAPPGPPDGAA